MTQLREVTSEEPRRLMLTTLMVIFEGGTKVSGVDGPYWEGTRTLASETARFNELCSKGGWFAVANGTLFNTDRILSIDIDQQATTVEEGQEPA